MQGLTERLGFFASLLNNKEQLLTVFENPMKYFKMSHRLSVYPLISNI